MRGICDAAAAWLGLADWVVGGQKGNKPTPILLEPETFAWTALVGDEMGQASRGVEEMIWTGICRRVTNIH